MYASSLLLACAATFLCVDGETVYGTYIFSRHGDRTAKATPPSNLTDLGYLEVFDSGTYFRNRYVACNSTSRIAGISSDLVSLSQVNASAPADNVLMSSAVGFLQGLYPPIGPELGSQKLRNGTVVEAPLNGYQIIPVATVGLGTNAENVAFIQSTSQCQNAITSSKEYLTTSEYLSLLNSTRPFYNSLLPLYNGTFNASQASFANAYSIFDLLNVASIDNTTFDPSDTLSPTDLFQLRTLADNHEFNLAFNASESVRAIQGAVLAGQILAGLNATITSAGRQKVQVQFGAYASFLSFFGLANLTDASSDFFGLPDYASVMVFELFTNDTTTNTDCGSASTTFPAETDLNVRFLFHNRTSSASDPLVAFPLFDQSATVLSWANFQTGMGKIAITTKEQFCSECGSESPGCGN